MGEKQGDLLNEEAQAKFITSVPLYGIDGEGVLILNHHIHLHQKALKG